MVSGHGTPILHVSRRMAFQCFLFFVFEGQGVSVENLHLFDGLWVLIDVVYRYRYCTNLSMKFSTFSKNFRVYFANLNL